MLIGTINISDLDGLPNLKELHLSGNTITEFIVSKGFERLSTLTNLEILDLSGNIFNHSILQSLSAFHSLTSLNLASNRLNGTFNISDLDGLTNLKELHLSGNKITEFIVSKGFEKLSTLTNLEILDLSGNILNNIILQSLSALPFLKSLNLAFSRLNGTFNISDLDGLPNLKELHLSGNTITEFIVSKVQDYDYKSSVEKILLDDSSIDENFLGNLSRAFPSLKSLSMTQYLNDINVTLAIGEGSIFESLQHLYLNYRTLDKSWLQRIGKMRSLKTFSVPNCGLSGDIHASQGLCLLKHLKELDLSNNNLTGNLPWCLGNLTSLEMIDLSHNQLSGNLPWSLSNWASLRKLSLSFNHFSGILPSSLANWTSIQHLDFSANQFREDMSSSHFQSLLSLQYLDLSNNLLQIPISLTPFFNISQLTVLDVHNNTIYGDGTDTHDHNLKPKFQLEVINLIGNGDATEIPKFLYHQHILYSVTISSFKMRGMFPYWLLENNTRLARLDLSNNSLLGHLLLPNKPHQNLRTLDISHNNFNGSIPSQIGQYFPSLNDLFMSRNELKGSIPDSLCKNANLVVLDMSENNISGTIPKCIGNVTQLSALDLSNNNISGCLPNFGPSFSLVKLSKNRLQGSWKDAFYNCSALSVLDLSHNNVSGNIPSWIGNLSQLNYLVLGHNNLQGEIPVELCKLEQLSFLDLSHNRIFGHMIPCLNFIGYSNVGEFVTLEFIVKGNIYSYKLTVSNYISGIDVSCNNLRGLIPLQIGDLVNIKALNFSHNSLTGTIPPTFSNLKEIESLDLSYNNLQGTIPRQLTKLFSLAVFNVSYNNLSGPTPNRVAQFGTFDESSYKGNPFLCDWPLPKSCNEIDSSPSLPYGEESNNSLIDMETFYWSFGVAYGMVLISILAVLYINPRWRRVWFYYVQISIDNSYYFLIDNVPFLSSFKFPKFCRRIYRCIRD